MNQILENKDSIEKKEKRLQSKKKVFQLQFYTSIFVFLIGFVGYFSYWFYHNSHQDISKKIVTNYNISKLYTNTENKNAVTTYEENGITLSVIGLIEIPKLQLSYPILADYNDELLKTAPCRFYGPLPNENGNLCIAGHNYNNDKFFSKLSTLKKADEIKITDNIGNTLSYFITDLYEVSKDDLSPLETSDEYSKQVTLVTCNNSNSNRIILKAKNRSP